MHTIRPRSPRAPRARSGQTGLALLFWLFGLLLFVGPFLREPDRTRYGIEDTSRKTEYVSDDDDVLDLPFDQDVADLARVAREEDWGLEADPVAAITEASEARYALGSEALAANPLFDVWRLEAGKRTWEQECAGCHGLDGDGGGPAARLLDPRPRNLRKGLFKFKSTAIGDRPLRKDLLRTITNGLAGSSMPEFRLLPEERRKDVVEYVRYLAIRGEFEQTWLTLAWSDGELPDPDEVQELVEGRWTGGERRVVLPTVAEPEPDQASIDRGRELFRGDASCASCHGETGRGDGPTADIYRDGWGYPIRPRDLSSGGFRVGDEPEALWRVIANGIEGTPMPGALPGQSSEAVWDLVHYVQHLAQGGE